MTAETGIRETSGAGFFWVFYRRGAENAECYFACVNTVGAALAANNASVEAKY
jgi:hypothetical protein